MELLKKAKNKVTEEYLRSVTDLMMIKGRPHFYGVRLYVVSNVAHAGFGEVDLGGVNRFMVGLPRVRSGPYLECLASIFLVRIVKVRMR